MINCLLYFFLSLNINKYMDNTLGAIIILNSTIYITVSYLGVHRF